MWLFFAVSLHGIFESKEGDVVLFSSKCSFLRSFVSDRRFLAFLPPFAVTRIILHFDFFKAKRSTVRMFVKKAVKSLALLFVFAFVVRAAAKIEEEDDVLVLTNDNFDKPLLLMTLCLSNFTPQ